MKSHRARVLAVAAVVWAAACGDGEPDVMGPAPVPNRAPEAVGTIPGRTLPVGGTETVDVSPHFRDPDGDVLSYTAVSSNAGIVGVSVSGSAVTVTAVARGVGTITVTARDPQGLLAQQSFEVTVPNRAPAAGDTIPAQTLFVGETATVDASAHFRDPDGDPLSFAATSSDPDVAAVTVSGAAVTIRAIAAGVATVTVAASDADGAGAEQSFQITVPNREPEAVGTLPPRTLAAGETELVVVSPYFRDPDDDALTYTAASSNAAVAAVAVSGDSVAVTALAKGLATVTVTARDGQGLIAEQRFEVTVPNRAPAAGDAIPAQALFRGETATVDASAHFRDPDGDPLSYSATSSRHEIAAVTVSGATLTIEAVAAGVATVTVTASDPDGARAEQRFEVTVPNRTPEAIDMLPPRTLAVGEMESVVVSPYFRDPDGDALTYAAASSNADVATVTVSGDTVLITALAKGLATVTVTATDGEGLTAQQSFEVTVPNRAPEAVDLLPPRTIAVGETKSVVVSAYFRDPDGDVLTYTAASSNPDVATVSVSGDSVTVTALAKGLATITVTATDGEGPTAEQRFEVTVPNRAPEAGDAIPAQTLFEGETASVDASTHFRDPDGDPLAYTATSSSSEVATVAVSDAMLTIRAVAAGVATVTVTATDPEKAAVATSFDVTVVRPADPFQIELVFATPMTAAQEAAFRRAAERWMAILAPTDLRDARMNRTLGCGSDPLFQRYVETIDDLMIVVAVVEIDGPSGILGRAGPCWLRTASSLPLYGRIMMDAADLGRLGTRDLEEVILHEMGHVLGIGLVWQRLDLLRNPASATSAPDTHFTGPLAIAAFDEAGGTGYDGAKVPVENEGGPGSRNSHWREAVLALELMTPFQHLGEAEPLSAVTIQSLADLGYEVDPTPAEPYRLPSPDLARALEEAPRIPYGDDIWRGPLIFVDPNGRITRVIPR
ncbi:MAG: Ig-like domain-containing protein [Gemmatimonadetes bacterium]|nr:Ig-like domain-containing protein [Gemmatimonadota bacterium]